MFVLFDIKLATAAMPGVAQWIEHQPANQEVIWFDSQLGHMPGLWARSLVGGMCEATFHSHILLSLSVSFPSLLFK